jgi:hypothetical protein
MSDGKLIMSDGERAHPTRAQRASLVAVSLLLLLWFGFLIWQALGS